MSADPILSDNLQLTKIIEIDKKLYILNEDLASLINLKNVFYEEFLRVPIIGKSLVSVASTIFNK